MVTQKTIKDEVIRQGESILEYKCEGCNEVKKIPFNYFLRDQLIEHKGQLVDGDLEEYLKVETDLPEQIQCRDCESVYNIRTPFAIYKHYSNPNGLSWSSGQKAKQNSGSRDNIDKDLKKALKSISVKFSGTPKRI